MNNPMAWLADRIADVVGNEGARVRAEMAAGVAKTVDAARVSGALPYPLAQLPPSGRVRTSRGRLVGWSLRETSGSAPATVSVYAGADTADPTKLIASAQLAASAGTHAFPAAPGVFFAEGCSVAITGAAGGTLYFAGD